MKIPTNELTELREMKRNAEEYLHDYNHTTAGAFALCQEFHEGKRHMLCQLLGIKTDSEKYKKMDNEIKKRREAKLKEQQTILYRIYHFFKEVFK